MNKIKWKIKFYGTQLLRKITKLFKRNKIGYLTFQCNICGYINTRHESELDREVPSCICRSSVRMRSVIYYLSKYLFYESILLPNFPINKKILGIGLSDWEGYANILSERLDYTNTFFHKEPKLDIMNISEESEGKLDFIVSSEVFEHVLPPSKIAFMNCFKLLKPGGALILTVPFAGDIKQEHFPELNKFKVFHEGENKFLINTTINGETQKFDNLVFHGGDGETLEMRVFSLDSLLDEIQRAGFTDIQVHCESILSNGIVWVSEKSLPITATKPGR